MKAKCIKEYIEETEGINFKTGHKYIKRFLIKKNSMGTATYEQNNNRIMIRFDIPIIALNENKAPYGSKMYRTFIPIQKNIKLNTTNWQLII